VFSQLSILPKNFWAGAYNPEITRVIQDKNGNYVPKFKVISELVFTELNGKKYEGSLSMQSDKDISDEINRLKLDLKNIRVSKHLRVHFSLVNLGQLAANNVTLKCTTIEADNVSSEGEISKGTIEGNKESGFDIDLYKPPTYLLPPEIKFKIKITFDIDGIRETSKEKIVTYSTLDARWHEL